MNATTDTIPALVAIHAHFDSDTLVVWGETDAPADWRPGRRGRRSLRPAARHHRYAAPHAHLEAWLATAGCPQPTGACATTVTLPSVSTLPQPSAPALGAGRPDPTGVRHPAPWWVPAACYAAAQAPAVLDAIATHAARLGVALDDFAGPATAVLVAANTALRAYATGAPDRETLANALEDRYADYVASPGPWPATDVDINTVAAAIDTLVAVWQRRRPCVDWTTEALLAAPRVDPTDPTADPAWAVSLVLVADDGRRLTPAEIATLDPTEGDAARATWADAVTALRSVHPDLDALARTPRLAIDSPVAVRLLDAADRLRRRGIDLATETWVARSATVAASGTAEPSEGAGRFGLSTLCDFTWDFSVAGHHLDRTTIESLTAARRRLVATPDGWVLLSPAQAKALRACLGANTAGAALTIADDPTLSAVDITAMEPRGWLAELADPATSVPVDLGGLFVGDLHDYQAIAVERIAFLARFGFGALLFDEMGLGKTVMGLALVAATMAAGDGPTLVIAPKSMVRRWAEEASTFVPTARVVVHHGGDRRRDGAFDADVIVTTHDTVRRDIEMFAGLTFARVIVDEAHEAKNPASKLHHALRRLRCTQMVVATGTPVQNTAADLFALVDLALPGLLGAAASVVRQRARTIDDGTDIDATDGVMRVLSPFLVYRTKRDVGLDETLPPLTFQSLSAQLTAEQALHYRQIIEAYTPSDDMSKFEKGAALLKMITKLKQVCDHPELVGSTRRSLFGRSVKFDATVDAVEANAAAGIRTLVFTQYASMAALLAEGLRARLGEDRVATLTGDTSTEERAQLAGRLEAPQQASWAVDVAVLTVRAGGVGLTLTGASAVIHYDQWWNPALEDQATARAHRIGQTRPVTVTTMACEGTIETNIAALLADKRSIADRLFGASGDGKVIKALSALSTAELTDALGYATAALAA